MACLGLLGSKHVVFLFQSFASCCCYKRRVRHWLRHQWSTSRLLSRSQILSSIRTSMCSNILQAISLINSNLCVKRLCILMISNSITATGCIIIIVVAAVIGMLVVLVTTTFLSLNSCLKNNLLLLLLLTLILF